jgi:substrate import-associated zinc metallohydrolase lipoprotein
MKKIFYTLLCIVALGFTACQGDKFGPTIYIDPIEDLDAYTREFDLWLKKYYTDKYNVEFLYRLDDSATDPNYNVVPVSIGKADTIAHLALYLWYDVYDSVVSPTFLLDNGPKMIQLIGSAMINAAQGTEKLGYAEGGSKITLLKINKMETNNIEQLNEYIFKTMHHEFSHILHQQKAYPKEFGQITPYDYDPNRWQDRSAQEAWELGYVSNYASSQTREDFVETIANYIVKTDADWNYMIEHAGEEGATAINQKLEMCRGWLAEKWEVDLDAMRVEVQKRQANLDWDYIMSLGFLHEKDEN